MKPKPSRGPSHHPLLLNGVLLLVMSSWAAATVSSAHATSDSNEGAFIVATLVLPLLNGCFALHALVSRRRGAASVFALCTLAWGGWAVFFITNTVLSFHKIGG